jgi:hypothetical protein
VVGSFCVSLIFEGPETLGLRGTLGGAPRISLGSSTGRSLRPRGGLTTTDAGAEGASVELSSGPAAKLNCSTGKNVACFASVGLFGNVGDATRSAARAGGGGDFGSTFVFGGRVVSARCSSFAVKPRSCTSPPTATTC